ncbi:hypothetical protein SNK04_005358 [Fusarium graminearum]
MASNPPHRGSRFQPGPTTVARVQLFSSLLNITVEKKQPWQLSQSAHPPHLTRPVTPHWWCILRPSLQPVVGNKRRPQTHAAAQTSGLQKRPQDIPPATQRPGSVYYSVPVPNRRDRCPGTLAD